MACLVAAVGSGALSLAAGADWPQWRGPSRDGVAVGMTLPDPWPKELKTLWQVQVGLGHSSPVVAAGKVVVMSRADDAEVVRCCDAKDGRVLWTTTCDSVPYTPRPAARAHGKGPFATPTIAAGKVYTFGISGILSCYDLEKGKLLWRRDFAKDFKKTYPMWGSANSPLIEGNLCILGVGARNNGALVALEKNSGEAVWKRAIDGPAYASPIAVNLAGERQVVTLMQRKVVGVAASNGKVLWQAPFTTQYEMNIVTPVVRKDMVVYTGYKAGTMAVRIRREGDKFSAEPAWANKEESMFLSSPVVHGDHLFGLSMRGRGTLVCLNLEDGKTAWASPGRMGQYASIVRVRDKLLVLKTGGELLPVAAASNGYKELGKVRLTNRPVYAHLAVTSNRIYLKDKTHLTCLELPGG